MGCAGSKEAKDKPHEKPSAKIESQDDASRDAEKKPRNPGLRKQNTLAAVAGGVASVFNRKKEKHVNAVNGFAEQVDQQVLQRKTSRRMQAEDVEVFRRAIKNTLFFKELKDEEIDALSGAAEHYSFEQGELVVTQGEVGSHFFVIGAGQFEVYQNKALVNTLSEGAAFGEIALIYNCPRSASVKAVGEENSLWGVGRVAFRKILRELSQRSFEENCQFIAGVPMFAGLNEADQGKIAELLGVTVIKPGQVAYSAGDPGDALYIVKTGLLTDAEGREYKSKASFGEQGLLTSSKRATTITAKEESVCLFLKSDQLGQVLGGVGAQLDNILYRNLVRQGLLDAPVFASFEESQLSKLTQLAHIVEFPHGTLVHSSKQKGLVNIRFFVVLHGQCEIAADDGKGAKQVLSSGQCFGEEYVKRQEQASDFTEQVKAVGNVPLKLALLNTVVIKKVYHGSDLNETIDFNQRLAIVKKVAIFRALSAMQQKQLVASFEVIPPYMSGQEIVREGEPGNMFFVIKEGEVRASRGDKVLRTMGKNDYFGERSLLYDEPRSATITVTQDHTEVWAVKKSDFIKIIQGPMREHLEYRIRLQDTNVAFSDLKIVRVVGRGTFGTVKLVQHKKTQTRYALKCVRKKTVVELQQEENVRMEREILAENDHPFIVHLVRTFKDDSYLYMLTELVTGGELYDAIRKLGLLQRPGAQFYLGAMGLSIEYLHEKKIVFRDLKPENVLLDSHGYVKLIDFGCARKLGLEKSYTLVGTPHYMSPDVILGKGYTTAVDIWALGVCLFEFLCGPLPFGNDAEDQLEVFRDILTAKLQFPSYVTDTQAIHLMKRLLHRSPETRLGCSLQGFMEIKLHPFFEGFSWDDLLGRQLNPPLLPVGETFAEDNEEANSGVEEEEQPEPVLDCTFDKDF